NAADESSADFSQHLVPDLVAERIVHVLEVVEIEEGEAERCLVTIRTLKGGLEQQHSAAAIPQARQRIHHRFAARNAQLRRKRRMSAAQMVVHHLALSHCRKIQEALRVCIREVPRLYVIDAKRA